MRREAAGEKRRGDDLNRLGGHINSDWAQDSIVSPTTPFELVSDFLVVVKGQIGDLSLIGRGSEARERTMTPPVSVTVSVFNDAAVPALVLAEAQQRATAVMSHAGVSLVWLDRGTPCSRGPESGCSAIAFPRHLSVRLVSKSTPSKADIFGQSFQDDGGQGSYAVVYYRGLAASKAAETLHTGNLLGLVVAHEVGHLLLGRNSHSADGLMAAVWQVPELHRATQGNLFFSRDQADQIRVRYLAASARLIKASEPLNASSGK